MSKRIYSILILSIGIVFAIEAHDIKLEKTVVREFAAGSETSLELTNKYGDLIINTWEKDSILIRIKVVTYGKNEDAAEKLMDRIEFDFDETLDYLEVKTVFDRKTGFFNDLWKNVSDYSKSILNSNKVSVDYEVSLPSRIAMELRNKYGDVFIEERSGETILELSNGDLKTDELSGPVKLDLSFCEADIKSLDKASLEFKGSEIEIEKAHSLKLTSSGSVLRLDTVSILNLDSRNDKITITEIDEIDGNGNFSKIYLSRINTSANLDLSYGLFSIKDIPGKFSEIDIKSKSTDIQLIFDKSAYFAADVTAREDRLQYPRNKFSLKIQEVDDKLVSLTGRMGAKESGSPSRLDIYSQNGDVEISFSANL